MKKRTKRAPITTRVNLRIVSFDLDDLIKKHYGLSDLSVVEKEGWQSGTKHSYVITKGDCSGDENRKVNEWLNGGAWPGVHTIMIDMSMSHNYLDVYSYYVDVVVQHDAVVTQNDDGSFIFPKGLYDLWHNSWPQPIIVNAEWMAQLSQSPGWTNRWHYRRSKRQWGLDEPVENGTTHDHTT